MEENGTITSSASPSGAFHQIIDKIYKSKPHELPEGTLYLVPTPIGNLEDFTLRALRILSKVDWIAAEDTRHTGLLLHRLGIKKKLISTHQHNEASRIEMLHDLLKKGSVGALVSDAGTPGISDPGQRVVRELAAKDVQIVALPGACALTTALSVSGFSNHEFFFSGFLPIKSGQRIKKMRQLAEIKSNLIFYESPHKMQRFMKEMKEVFPEKNVVIGREITKKFEEIIRGLGKDLADSFADKKWKGELVVVVENG